VGKGAGRERVRRRAHHAVRIRIKMVGRRKSAFAHPTAWAAVTLLDHFVGADE
jgi:hypothetical protein